MCARWFLIAVFVLTLLAVAAGFAVYEWGGNILVSQATPKGHFEAARAGGAPDYAATGDWLSNPQANRTDDPSAWLPAGATPGAPGAASVFYIHPTTYFATDRWNAPLSADPATEARTRLFVQSQASAFAAAGPIWAPRYRQAAFGAFLLKSDDAQQALDLAYGDVARAFDAFLAQAPKDRGIVLAGHSQGALLLERLLRDKVAGKAIASRVIAAYVVGWPISATADLPALGLPACAAPNQAGCILSWMSFGDPANPSFFDDWEGTKGLTGGDRRRADALCVNPVSGVAGGSAQPQANLGTLVPNAAMTDASLEPHRVGAFCSKGLLIINGDVPAFTPPPLPGNNFHVYDYALFWGSIRQDAANRTAAWNDHDR